MAPNSPFLSLLPLLLFFALNTDTSCSADHTSISNQSSISGSQKLVSQGGTFALGFFLPGNNSSQKKYYVGIWYNKVSQLTPVWVANRDTPVTDHTTSVLKISKDGNLVLLDQSKAQVWSTNLSFIASTVAVLCDTGNLVLKDALSSSSVLWQSFDHPTDTWLPGARLGMNKLDNSTQHLISWKNSADPAPGIFSLEADPAGTSQYFIVWNMSNVYWSSGTWNGKIFSSVPEMGVNHIYSFEYIESDNEKYFTYYVMDNSIISRFMIDVSGQIKQLTWVESSQEWILLWSKPIAQCDVEAFCGPFGSCSDSGLPYCCCVKGFSKASPEDWILGDQKMGCARNTPLQCRGDSSTKADEFYSMANMKLPDNPQASGAENANDCAVSCLNNCSCTAYSFTSRCSLWHGDLINLKFFEGLGDTLYLRLAASELQSSKCKKGLPIGVFMVVAVGLVVVACLATVWVWLWRRQHWRRLINKSKAMPGAMVRYRYSELQHVTKNFSEKLGGGGFGSVFKGVLPDSTIIAVKKLEGVCQGEKQFRSEVSTIGVIQHVNLVRLIGFCSQGTKRLLVYDYMPKGSLGAQLFHNKDTVLDWNTRYQIALGTARGLAYLHERCRDCIIHCDIKPENILLDTSFVPKVADFGLAKLVGRDFSRVLTTMRGTLGYLAPEWISGVAITAKADVYSYGMMLLEIISGRRNSDEGSGCYFPISAANKLVEGNITTLLDHKLAGDANMEEVDRASRVACWCIQDDEIFRPTMGEVIQILEGAVEVGLPPIPRWLQILAANSNSIVFLSDSSPVQTSQLRSTTSTSAHVKSTTSVSSKD